MLDSVIIAADYHLKSATMLTTTVSVVELRGFARASRVLFDFFVR